LFDDPRYPYRWKAMIALSTSSNLGSDCDEIVPRLARCLKGQNALESEAAAFCVGNLHRCPTILVPALIDALESTNAFLRVDCLMALISFGADSKCALPAVTNLLVDKAPVVRQWARNSIDQITLAVHERESQRPYGPVGRDRNVSR
jgi:hypothetical protein